MFLAMNNKSIVEDPPPTHLNNYGNKTLQNHYFWYICDFQGLFMKNITIKIKVKVIDGSVIFFTILLLRCYFSFYFFYIKYKKKEILFLILFFHKPYTLLNSKRKLGILNTTKTYYNNSEQLFTIISILTLKFIFFK